MGSPFCSRGARWPGELGTLGVTGSSNGGGLPQGYAVCYLLVYTRTTDVGFVRGNCNMFNS